MSLLYPSSMMTLLRSIILFLWILSLSEVSWAKLSQRKWQKLETPHFDILFDAEQRDLALEYAVESEMLHELLRPYFSGRPSKTFIILNDDTDMVDAKATVFPKYQVWISPKYPLMFFDYNFLYYDSWKYTVLMHEYTHILQLSDGVSKPLRWIFGNIFNAQLLSSKWYIEGLATDIESWFSDAGRLNSPIFYANVRAMVEGGTWGSEKISRFNERFMPTYPFGSRRYFYGSLLMNEISTYRGLDKMNLLNSQNGKILIFKSQAARKVLKTSYRSLLQTTYDRWERYIKDDLNKLKQTPFKETRPLPLFNTSQNITKRHNPQISPDGKHLLFIQRSIEKGHYIVLLTRSDLHQSFFNSKGKVIAFGSNIQTINWINNEEFVFSRINNIHKNNLSRTYNDLYKGHISGRRPRQLTFGKRLQFPTLSWDQKHLLAIQTKSNQNTLVQVHLDTKEITPLYFAGETLLSYPFPLTEDEIVFLSKKSYKASQIHIWNKTNQQVTLLPGQIFSHAKQHKHIVFLTPVQGGLLYTSTASGVANLYFWNSQTQISHPVTHSQTAIRDGIFDPHSQELWISQLHSDGYRLEVQKSTLESIGDLPQIRIPHSTEKKANLADMQEVLFCHRSDVYLTWQINKQSIESLKESSCQEAKMHQENIRQQVDYLRQKWQKHFQNTPPPIKKYQGLSYLFPHFWLPLISWSSNSGFESTLLVRGSDPLEHHQYKTELTYSWAREKQNQEKLRGISNITFNYKHYKQWYFDVIYTKQNILLERDQEANITANDEVSQKTVNLTLYRKYFLNTYWNVDLGWRLTGSAYAHPEVDTQYVHGPQVALNYQAKHPDTSFLSSQIESFYIQYTRPFYFNRVIGSKASAFNEVIAGTYFVWSFPSPLKWMSKARQPLRQNSSLRYHQFSVQTDHTFTPEEQSIYTTIANPGLMSKYRHLIRGYSNETFIGWQLHSLNLEYTLPFFGIYSGTGAFFLRNTDIALVFDSLLFKGYYENKDNKLLIKTSLDRLFTSVGMELKFNVSVGYDLPMSIRTGIYYGLNRNIAQGVSFGLHLENQL